MIVLRPGNAGANTATNRVETIRRALDQGGLGPPVGQDAGQPCAGSCPATARSCASTTSRATDPWPWPPTPASVSSPTSKPTAGCKNAARTASGARKRSRALHSGGSPVELDRFALQGCAVSRVWCLLAAPTCRPAGLLPNAHLSRHPARRWEPKTVRLPLMSVPAVIARRTVLRYKAAPRPASS